MANHREGPLEETVLARDRAGDGMAAPRRRARQLAAEPLESVLAAYLRTRDIELRDEIVRRHSWLARACARQMRRHAEPLDELEQVAMIGIFKAAQRFDPSFGVQFKTYASVTAIGELRRHYRDAGWPVQVPRRVKDMHLQVQQAAAELTAQLSRPPTNREIACWLGTSVAHVVEAQSAGEALHSRPLVADGADDTHDGSSSHWPDEADDRSVARDLIARLDERKQRIVMLRFFAQMTQQEIAGVLGISQVQISRLIRDALVEMRSISRRDHDRFRDENVQRALVVLAG